MYVILICGLVLLAMIAVFVYIEFGPQHNRRLRANLKKVHKALYEHARLL